MTMAATVGAGDGDDDVGDVRVAGGRWPGGKPGALGLFQTPLTPRPGA